MLIAKFYINKDQIDEVHIKNVGPIPPSNTYYRYKIRKPEGFDHLEVYHKRDSGYRPLIVQVLSLLCTE